jgi:hypothetical protein
MEQVQCIAPVVHEVDALTGNIDQPEQSSCTGGITGIVKQGREYLIAMPICGIESGRRGTLEPGVQISRTGLPKPHSLP